MDPQSGTSKWELVRNAFANAAKNGLGALKLQALMRGTFIREHIVPTTVVTRNKISTADDGVSKHLLPRDTGIRQSIFPVKVVENGNCFIGLFPTLSLVLRAIMLSVGYDVCMSWSQTFQNTPAMKHTPQCQVSRQISNTFLKALSLTNNIPQSLKNEIMKSANDGQYSSLLHLYATANAFKRPIVSIFPQIEHIAINRPVNNQTISPLDCSEEQHGPPMYIM